MGSLRQAIADEAAAARRAAPSLRDDLVADALRRAAVLVGGRRAAILAANRADCEAAEGRLDAGTLDRLRLDDARLEALAHAEGGGVLYVHGSASPARASALVDASLDRLGVCNRLNLLLVDRDATALGEQLVEQIRGRGLDVAGTVGDATPLDRPIGYEWANDAERVGTVTAVLVDGLEDAVRVANDETSGLAAGIVAEDEAAAEAFLDGYRGTAAFWHATTRFTDGFALTGSPETGINVDGSPGPRGPVTYRDLWLRQYRVIGDATQRR